MAQGRHREALQELEYAASEIERNPRTWEVLADCHEALGNEEEASEWRKKAEKLRETLQREAKERLAERSPKS
jgi:predicted Zn-dependent protease